MDNYNQDFSNYTVLDSEQSSAGVVAKKFMANVFMLMSVAVGISALFAYLYSHNASLISELYTQTERGLRPTVLGWVVTFAPMAFILIMNFGLSRMSVQTLMLIFLAFSAVFGISLSYIFFVYQVGSIINCFISSAAMFGVMAFLGYTTDKDLTSFGRILQMGLIGMIIAIVINIFMRSGSLDYIISIVGVAIFTGLTAFDTQKLKNIGAGLAYEGASADSTRKLAIMGAVSLYLDFLNLFMFVLSLFGGRKD